MHLQCISGLVVQMNLGRVLAVDPGDVRIGLAISDPMRVIAKPHKVLLHQARQVDARAILEEALNQEAVCIVIGVAYDLEGNIGPQARKSLRLMDAIRALTELPVIAWDETGTTIEAQRSAGQDADLDARAAAAILQEYLDAQAT